MKNETKKLGSLGEKVAAKYLKKQGYKILEMNFQNVFGRRLGEIDIIARDIKEKELVFVEVKTREYQKFKNTNPEDNITYSKIKRMAKIANFYLRTKHWENIDYRFDAVSVWLDPILRKAKVKHIIGL